MKLSLIILLLIMNMAVTQNNAPAKETDSDTFGRLYSLLDKKEYFKFRNLFEASKGSLEEWQVLYFEAMSANFFNKHEASNTNANTLFGEFDGMLSDSLKKNLYSIMILNHVYLFNYSEAMALTEKILSEYKSLLDDKDKEEYENTLSIWKIAKNVPPQTAEIRADSKLELINSFAGKNVKTVIGGKTFEFIFDTGANFSVIIKSLAEELGLKFYPGTFKVTSVTGEKLTAELGVAESLSIGNMTFRNVLFLVFPDEAFTFGPGMTIEGIVGFPVINAMKEIRISENELFVPEKPFKKGYNNLALNGFTPVIEIIVGNDSLSFGFDTGANTTMLYAPYYESYKEEVDKNFKKEKFRFGGAGGIIEAEGFLIDSINLKTGEVSVVLEDIHLLPSPLGERENDYYGNLGRDFIGQYDTYIINFEDMFIDFEK